MGSAPTCCRERSREEQGPIWRGWEHPGEAGTELKNLGRERGQRPQTSPKIAGLIKHTDEDSKVNTCASELCHCQPASWQICHVPISWHPAQVFRVTSSPPDLPASASERKSLGFTDFLSKSEGETFYPEKANANC